MLESTNSGKMAKYWSCGALPKEARDSRSSSRCSSRCLRLLYGSEVKRAATDVLATSPDADRHMGTNIEAQFLCHELGLLPGWSGPTPNSNELIYDLSGARLAELEKALSLSG